MKQHNKNSRQQICDRQEMEVAKDDERGGKTLATDDREPFLPEHVFDKGAPLSPGTTGDPGKKDLLRGPIARPRSLGPPPRSQRSRRKAAASYPCPSSPIA